MSGGVILEKALGILLLQLGLLAGGSPALPATPSERELAPGATRRAGLAPGGRDVWALPLEEGWFARVEVRALAGSIQVALSDPEGIRLEELNLQGLSQGAIRWTAPSEGVWRLEIAAESARAAEYAIEWKEARACTATDRDLIRADDLDRQGDSLFSQNQYAEAESRYRRALQLSEATLGPDDLEVAVRLTSLAEALFRQGRHGEADRMFGRAAEIRGKVLGPDSALAAESLVSQGFMAFRQAQFERAGRLFERALQIQARALGREHLSVADTLNLQAVLNRHLGRYGRAEPLYREALEIYKKLKGPEHEWVAVVLSNLGLVLYHQGETDQAEAALKESLRILENTVEADDLIWGAPLINLGLVYVRRQRYEEAKGLYLRALRVGEANAIPDDEVAMTLHTLGSLYREQGLFEEAEGYLQRSLALWEEALGPEHPHVALDLIALGQIAARRGSSSKALELLDRAIDILESARALPGDLVTAYAERAHLFKKQGRLDRALRELREALAIAEEIRPQTGGGEATRAAFFQRYADEFDRMVAWQLEAGDIEAALDYSERGRARVFLDQLWAGRIDLRDGIPEEARLELDRRESAALLRMVECRAALAELRGHSGPPDPDRRSRAAEWVRKLAAAQAEYSSVYAEIKTRSALWHDLLTSKGAMVELRDIQRHLVPEEGLMLIYQLGPEVSQVFVIGPDRGEIEALPLTIDAEAASLLGLPAGPLTSELTRRALGGNPGLLFGLSGTIAPLQRRLHGLWRILAPATLWERMKKASEVVVVPDGALANLPFEALLVQMAKDWQSSRFWLDSGPVVRYAPSATVLYNIEKRSSPRATMGGEPILLSLADPIFDRRRAGQGRDAVQAAASLSTESGSGVGRAAFLRAGELQRLPGTARESDSILSSFSDSEAKALREAEATEANFRAALASKQYLHLATHGLVDEQPGSLFAALAFTPPPDASPQTRNDGLLELYEIYELPLDAAELTVLSACDTNLGPNVEGEGVFALSRGFLAAGARRVIASHWKVDDDPTAALMGAAFTRIARARHASERIDYAAALRDAKLEVRRKPGWSAPFFWAPFTLTGKR